MEISVKKLLSIIGFSLLGLMVLVFAADIGETFTTDEYLVIESPLDGILTWYGTDGTGGFRFQWFGTPTHYQKRSQFFFTKANVDHAESSTETIYNGPIKVRFNDGGHGDINGSIAWEMPGDIEHLTNVHVKYGSQVALEQELIRPIIEKAIYMSGPLLSSRESYAQRRNELLNFIRDQIEHGVYKTRSYDVEEMDALSGQKRTVTKTDILKDKDGSILREDVSPLVTFGIRVYNLSLNSIDYAGTVEDQITAQQEATMMVQTAIAKAREAEQKALTVEMEGKAKAMDEKWKQEAIKAKAVTEAEQKLEVARLAAKAAEQYKRQQILEGQGDAEKKRLVMFADGALQQKLSAIVQMNKDTWESLSKVKGLNLVPLVQGGGGGSNAQSNPVNDLIMLLNAEKAQALKLNLDVKGK